MLKNVKIGDVLDAQVTGIQNYGVFVKFVLSEETKERQGLIHISEVKSGFIKNIKEIVQEGKTVKAQVVDIDEYDDKISFSLRTLEAKPEHHQNTRKSYFTDPRKEIGFEPFKQLLPQWMEENKKYLKTLEK
ncbi:MAG: CvfD/Ygs/GSP13 family RNA-binding post-transcriptional regulator [Streptococcaceae bacterium]|nr:CvfD/Ygs/GSP13 family RNA-binding post-transcriptional regulator [Streptococcaceae bacterium]